MRHWSCLPVVVWSLIIGAATSSVTDAASAIEPAASRQRQIDRVQLHRNGARGVAYLPRAVPDGDEEPDRIEVRRLAVLPLGGDPDENVRGGLYPIDVDGDGTYEFLHFNGYRMMRVIEQNGGQRWEIRNPRGREHRDYVHRDTLAVLDVDGDRRQEIVHCGLDRNGSKRLIVRSGLTGAVVNAVPLAGDNPGDECQIAAFRMEGREDPVIMVSRRGDVPGARCGRDWVDLWPVVAAYGPDLRRLWQRTNCDAGHYVWPLDEDGDGLAEGVFIGKYLVRADGTLRCTLPNWGGDHVDSMVIGDLDARREGLEAMAVGLSGGRLYDASNCDLLADAPSNVLDYPQHINAALLDPSSGAPSLVVRSRNSIRPGANQAHLISLRGRILDDFREPDSRHLRPQQNANLDDAEESEDLVTSFGQVIDERGRIRLDTDWYWDLDGEGGQRGSGEVYRRWTSAPLVFDLDGDGRDEIVTWGRERIVVGGAASDDDDRDGDDDSSGRNGDDDEVAGPERDSDDDREDDSTDVSDPDTDADAADDAATDDTPPAAVVASDDTPPAAIVASDTDAIADVATDGAADVATETDAIADVATDTDAIAETAADADSIADVDTEGTADIATETDAIADVAADTSGIADIGSGTAATVDTGLGTVATGDIGSGPIAAGDAGVGGAAAENVGADPAGADDGERGQHNERGSVRGSHNG